MREHAAIGLGWVRSNSARVGATILAITPCLIGQMPRSPTTYHTITSDDGLSQDAAQCMIQEQRGLRVFGTKQGLNYYDGSRFEVFHHDPEVPDRGRGNALA